MSFDELKEWIEMRLNSMEEEFDEKLNDISRSIKYLNGDQLNDAADRMENNIQNLHLLTSRYTEEYVRYVEDNMKRFANMINEYKGLVSIERAKRTERASLIMKFLADLPE